MKYRNHNSIDTNLYTHPNKLFHAIQTVEDLLPIDGIVVIGKGVEANAVQRNAVAQWLIEWDYNHGLNCEIPMVEEDDDDDNDDYDDDNELEDYLMQFGIEETIRALRDKYC